MTATMYKTGQPMSMENLRKENLKRFGSDLGKLFKAHGYPEHLKSVFLSENKNGESLLRKRNLAWIEKLKEISETDSDVFVFVGAAHLYGKHNLIEGLKAAGFSLKKRPATRTKTSTQKSSPKRHSPGMIHSKAPWTPWDFKHWE